MASTSKRRAARAKRKSRALAFPVKFRLWIVKLHHEEGYSHKLIAEQFGIITHSIQRWVKAFRLTEPQGLNPIAPSPGRAAFPRRSVSRRWKSSGSIPSTARGGSAMC